MNFSTSNFFMLHHTYPPFCLAKNIPPSLPKPKNLTLHRFGCPSKVHDHQGFSCIPTATCNDSARRKATGLGGVEESSGRNPSNLCLHRSHKTAIFPPPKKLKHKEKGPGFRKSIFSWLADSIYHHPIIHHPSIIIDQAAVAPKSSSNLLHNHDAALRMSPSLRPGSYHRYIAPP